MKFKSTVAQYETVTFEFEKNEDICYIEVIHPTGESTRIVPFLWTDVEFKYDDEGFESVTSHHTQHKKCNYAPSAIGTYKIKAVFQGGLVKEGAFTAVQGSNHGYIRVSEKDKKYFSARCKMKLK